MKTLVVPAGVHHEMVEHCRTGMPNEACGFLGGRDGVAERLYPMTNEAASPVLYRPPGKEMIAALSDMDEAGLDLVGIFHSHVASPPYPSPTDINFAHYPDAVYLIVSLASSHSPETRGFLIHKKDWRDERGEVEEIELVIS